MGKWTEGEGRSSLNSTPTVRTSVKQRGRFNEWQSIDGHKRRSEHQWTNHRSIPGKLYQSQLPSGARWSTPRRWKSHLLLNLPDNRLGHKASVEICKAGSSCSLLRSRRNHFLFFPSRFSRWTHSTFWDTTTNHCNPTQPFNREHLPVSHRFSPTYFGGCMCMTFKSLKPVFDLCLLVFTRFSLQQWFAVIQTQN